MGCCTLLHLTEDNARFVLLAIVLVLYMLAGAAIFQYLEGDEELAMSRDFWATYSEFRRHYLRLLQHGDYASNFSSTPNSTDPEEDSMDRVHRLLYAYGNATAAGIIHKRRRWDFAGSFHFVATVVSTIGYGNTTPQTTVGKTAVILYGFLGCSGGILFFNLFLERIITFLAYVLRSCHLRRIKKRMEQGSLASRRASRVSRASLPDDLDEEDAAEASLDNWKPSVYWVMLYLTMASIVVASCAAAVYAPFEDWTYFEAIYFCFVSFATIGFGDYVSTQEPAYPHVHWYRFGNFVFLVLGCCCIYSLFNVTSIVIKQALNWMIIRLDCRCLEDATGAAGRAWRRQSIRMQSRRRRRRSSAGMPRHMRRGRKPHQIAAVLGRTTTPMCVAEGTKKPPDDSDSNYDSEGEGAGGRRLSGEMISMKDFLQANKVNSNGLLSFLTEIPSFFNIQFPLDYPVIAPLYTNVDTRGSGTVYYRETQDPSLLERASDAVRESFSSAADFTATSLFIATWDNVGYYNRGSDKVNTFQVVICSDGDDSYVQFLYADGGIQWIQSTGQSTGLPDARAQAGLMSGDGRLFTLRGSGTDQIQNLDKWSNIQVPGMWLFHVGLTGRGGNVAPPDLDGTSEAGKTDSCTLGKTLCHSKSHCVDHVTGFCCHCHSGYYGNGFNCLKEGIPLRVNGKVSGIVNGQEFSQLDLQSYVVTSDGRTYTAISRVQSTIGYDMQTLNVLGGVIGWLFARPLNKASNGYALTGGVFNHTAEISFPLTGNDVVVRQRYLGLDVFDQLKMEAEIQGSLPTIPVGTKIQIPDYEEQYTRTEPGVMVAKSSLIYRLDGVPVDNPFTVEQTVRFSECPHAPLNVSTVRLKVARNFISYEGRENIIRYAMTDKVTLSSDFDPCKEGRSKCGEHSFCRVEGNSFSCACNQGFQHLYSESDGVGSEICVDINECQTGAHDCDVNALCINEEGSYACQCVSGFVGNGQSCQKLETCEDLNCHPDAECVQVTETALQCQCLAGFTGDGVNCVPSIGRESCDQANDCSVYGACTLDATSDKYVCVCLPGYLGDGYYCVDSELHSNYTGSGVPVPTCVLGICWCPEGYDLEGQNSCAKKSDYDDLVTDTDDTEDSLTSCNIVNTCHPHAQCVLITQDNKYRCQCDAGYEGDGYECGEIDVSCEEVDICDIHATCTYDELREKAVCLCNPGYQGDGILCSVADECSGPEDCGGNAKCDWSRERQHYACLCVEGHVREGAVCVPEQGGGCNILNNCDEHARCLYDSESDEHRCVCDAGFTGDGNSCSVDHISCNVLNNCGPGAECVYDRSAGGHRCRCSQGFHGDGLNCAPDYSCQQDLNLCSRDASCVLGPTGAHTCVCNQGYVGDGSKCKAASKYEGNFLLVSQGMATLRIPFKPKGRDVPRPISIQYFQMAIGIDIDCLGGRVYWSDVSGGGIKSSNYDGSNVTTFLKTGGSPEGVSVDWVSRNLYWTDSGKDTLEVAGLDSQLRKTLVTEGLVNPRGVVVHPTRGKVFWSDWNREAPKLEWANQDGSGRAVFLEGPAVQLPNSLAIDFDRDELCWADAGTKSIECVGIGNLAQRTVVANCSYPFGLTISHNSYYWTDWQTQRVESAERPSGKLNKGVDVPLGGSGKLYGIVAVPEHCHRQSNVCQFDNGQCSSGHLCLPNGSGGRSCVCGENLDTEGSGEAPICNDI